MEGTAFCRDRERVRNLRISGVDFSEIPQKTQIPEEQVIKYCKELGLPLAGSCFLAPLSLEEEMLPAKLCSQCGKVLIQKMRGRRRRFCSNLCRSRWWDKHREPEKQKNAREAICENCGGTFIAFNEYRNIRRYCSRQCFYQGKAGCARKS